MDVLIGLSNYGFNMGSRLQGRQIFEEILNNVHEKNVNSISIDFTGIRFMSLSFATELFNNLYDSSLFHKIEVKKTSPFIERQLTFVFKEIEVKKGKKESRITLVN